MRFLPSFTCLNYIDYKQPVQRNRSISKAKISNAMKPMYIPVQTKPRVERIDICQPILDSKKRQIRDGIIWRTMPQRL